MVVVSLVELLKLSRRESSLKPPRDPRLLKPNGQIVGSFRKGQTMLPNATARRLGNKVKLSWKLSSIGKMENGGYTLTYETPEGLVTLQSRTVVMTVPSHIASGLLRRISVCLINKGCCSRGTIKLYYPPVAAVSVSYPKEAVRAECLIDGELKGFGQLIPCSQGVETLGKPSVDYITAHHFFLTKHPLTTTLEGQPTLEFCRRRRANLWKQLNLRKMLINPNAKEPLALGVRVWPQAILQFLIGHLDIIDAATAALSNGGFQSMFLGGNYVSGV